MSTIRIQVDTDIPMTEDQQNAFCEVATEWLIAQGIRPALKFFETVIHLDEPEPGTEMASHEDVDSFLRDLDYLLDN